MIGREKEARELDEQEGRRREQEEREREKLEHERWSVSQAKPNAFSTSTDCPIAGWIAFAFTLTYAIAQSWLGLG